MEIGHSGVEAQEFLNAFPSSESLLLSLLSSCGGVLVRTDALEHAYKGI